MTTTTKEREETTDTCHRLGLLDTERVVGVIKLALQSAKASGWLEGHMSLCCFDGCQHTNPRTQVVAEILPARRPNV